MEMAKISKEMENANANANAIEISDVRKYFDTVEHSSGGFFQSLRRKKFIKKAVDGVSFNVRKGTIMALLGKNGSGKSTLIKMLVGIMNPDSGNIKILGMDPWKDRIQLSRKVGVVLGAHPVLYTDLPAIDNFEYIRQVYRIPKAEFKRRLDYLVGMLELKDVYNRQVRELSLGEKMKCNFVAAVLHMPELIVLDEPTIGVDLPSMLNLRAAVLDLQKNYGRTFLITTHILEDVRILAENVVIIDRGKKVFDDTKEKLSKLYGDYKYAEIYYQDGKRLNFSKYGKVVERKESYVKLEVNSSQIRNKRFTKLLADPRVEDFNIVEPEIQDVMKKFYTRMKK